LKDILYVVKKRNFSIDINLLDLFLSNMNIINRNFNICGEQTCTLDLMSEDFLIEYKNYVISEINKRNCEIENNNIFVKEQIIEKIKLLLELE